MKYIELRAFTVFVVFMAAGTFLGCTAPRSVIHSGKVTPKGQFRVGTDLRGNVPTATVGTLYDTLEDGVNRIDNIVNNGGEKLSGESDKAFLDKMVKTMLIYSLDPINMGYDFRVRYGVIDRVDIGYKYDSGVHVIDTRFQFGGATESGPGPKFFQDLFGPKWHGSIGIQFSKQSYEMPISYLEDLRELLGYEFKRYDFLIPLAVSYSFRGDKESVGSIGFGLVYNYGKLSYGFDNEQIEALFANTLESEGVTVPSGKPTVHAFGGFANLKVGYKYLYAIASLSIYYQDYGSYSLFGSTPASFSGFTIVPTIGLVGQWGGQ
jgi:hypothetical protein